jgi:hypothetical protein
MLSKAVQEKCHGAYLTRFVPGALCFPGFQLEILGFKDNILGKCGVLVPQQTDNYLTHARLGQTPELGLLYQHRFDVNLNKVKADKLVFVDVEYVQHMFPDKSSIWICPVAGITVVNEGKVIKTKCYVDNLNCDLRPEVRICQYANSLAPYTVQDGKRHLGRHQYNGGMDGLRSDCAAYAGLGYKLISKGAHVEAVILNDMGVSKPLNLSVNSRRCAKLEDCVGVYFAPDKRDIASINSPHPVLQVYELGGFRTEEIRAVYESRIDYDTWMDIYDSGIHAVSHNPVVETLTFAYHYLSNKYLSYLHLPTYGPFECIKMAKYDGIVQKKDVTFSHAQYVECWSTLFPLTTHSSLPVNN